MGGGKALDAEVKRLEDVTAARDAAALFAATSGLVRLGSALLAEYERHKAARALLDYDDLILKTRDLLHSPGVAPWVLFKLDGGLDHILIDEAQDTNPEQWQVRCRRWQMNSFRRRRRARRTADGLCRGRRQAVE